MENAVKKADVEVQSESQGLEGIQKQVLELKSQLDALSKNVAEDKLSMIVFSGDLDKVLASFIIATGATAMGMDVVMFFTFWGTPVLRDKSKSVGGKVLPPMKEFTNTAGQK